MKDFLIVIPARMGSTRLPGKVLADLGGRPVVEWCRQAALAAKLGPVIVATDSEEVERALKSLGAEVVMTPSSLASGSDRVWAAADKPKYRDYPFIMNFQGDAPFLQPETLRKVADMLRKNEEADIATGVVPLENPKDALNPNVVKAVMAKDGRCLYFSRSPIPHNAASSLGHLGIYAYRREALKRFVRLKPSPLETQERLEQLRALEDGMTIVAAAVQDSLLAIDTPEDLERARTSLTGVTTHG